MEDGLPGVSGLHALTQCSDRLTKAFGEGDATARSRRLEEAIARVMALRIISVPWVCVQ